MLGDVMKNFLGGSFDIGVFEFGISIAKTRLDFNRFSCGLLAYKEKNFMS